MVRKSGDVMNETKLWLICCLMNLCDLVSHRNVQHCIMATYELQTQHVKSCSTIALKDQHRVESKNAFKQSSFCCSGEVKNCREWSYDPKKKTLFSATERRWQTMKGTILLDFQIEINQKPIHSWKGCLLISGFTLVIGHWISRAHAPSQSSME